MNRESDFDTVFKEFHPKIVNYVSRLVGSDQAEDITQEVFERVSRGLEGFRGESKLSTWIFRIATNTALDKMKTLSSSRSGREPALEESSEVEDKDIWTGHKKRSLDQELIRKEMGECVREFIDKLPLEQRTIILLSELEGFKNREIADILQVSLDTVKIRLHRARGKLKKLLQEGCDFYSDEQATLACDRKPPVIKFRKTD